MHELAIAKSIVASILDRVDASLVKRVKTIHIDMGQMYDYEEGYLTDYVRELGADTVLSESEVKLSVIPITLKCKACGEIFADKAANPVALSCPKCGGTTLGINSGREMNIRSLEIEEYDDL